MSDYFRRFSDRRSSRNPYAPIGEDEGACSRCDRWTKRLVDELCFGCREHERRAQPPRVSADEHPTPGLRVPKIDSEEPVRALMLHERKRHAEAEKNWKPRCADNKCQCQDCVRDREFRENIS